MKRLPSTHSETRGTCRLAAIFSDNWILQNIISCLVCSSTCHMIQVSLVFALSNQTNYLQVRTGAQFSVTNSPVLPLSVLQSEYILYIRPAFVLLCLIELKFWMNSFHPHQMVASEGPKRNSFSNRNFIWSYVWTFSAKKEKIEIWLTRASCTASDRDLNFNPVM